MAKILVTDCWTNKSLSVVRSLGLAGHEVHVCSHKRLAAAIYSRFVKKKYFLPEPNNNPSVFYNKLKDLITLSDFDAVMPLEEATIIVLHEMKWKEANQFSKTIFLLQEWSSFEKANNKWTTYLEAQKVNVPAPLSFLPQHDEEIKYAISQLGYPFIIKPCSSSGSRGIKKIETVNDFTLHYPLIKKKYGNPILQQYLPQEGQGLGVGLLANKGKIEVAYTYKRLREFPVNGGPGTLRETTFDEELLEYAKKLMESLNFSGVAMIEFKKDIHTGKPMLMEINPRFWGSLELAQVAGINFPDLWYKMAKGEKIESVNYTKGIKCRWLLPGDIAHFIANRKRFSLQPSFFNFFDSNTHYDEFKKYDIKGSIACVLCTAMSIFDPEIWKKGVFRN